MRIKNALPTLELDDDTSTAPVRHDGNVVIKNLVSEGRAMQIGGSLKVGGAIEAAEVTVGGGVIVSGGIIGKQKGRYTIGGDLQCQFITGGELITRGSVQVGGEIAHSRLTCAGKLDVAGVIYGGDIAANGGIVCRSLGHVGGLPTIIEAGEGRTMRLLNESITPKIEANYKRAAAIRATIEPLMAKMKSLSPAQRERATELLFDADEMDEQNKTLVNAFDCRRRLIHQQADPKIVVAEIVQAGVTVRFGAVEAYLTSPVKGPLTLTTRKTESVTEIVIIDSNDGTVCALKTRSADVPMAA